MNSQLKINELEARINELELKHKHLVSFLAKSLEWKPLGCDDVPPGSLTDYCNQCGECHSSLTGCRGAAGEVGPDPMEAKDFPLCTKCNTHHHPIAGCSLEYYLSLKK